MANVLPEFTKLVGFVDFQQFYATESILLNLSNKYVTRRPNLTIRQSIQALLPHRLELLPY